MRYIQACNSDHFSIVCNGLEFYKHPTLNRSDVGPMPGRWKLCLFEPVDECQGSTRLQHLCCSRKEPNLVRKVRNCLDRPDDIKLLPQCDVVGIHDQELRGCIGIVGGLLRHRRLDWRYSQSGYCGLVFVG